VAFLEDRGVVERQASNVGARSIVVGSGYGVVGDLDGMARSSDSFRRPKDGGAALTAACRLSVVIDEDVSCQPTWRSRAGCENNTFEAKVCLSTQDWSSDTESTEEGGETHDLGYELEIFCNLLG
jgi:hypothetical protein